jgi:hypothetical protein
MAKPATPLPLRYARQLGWRMLPVWWLDNGVCACPDGAGCKSPGKHPLLKDWRRRASRDERILQRWLERWPACNWAVSTGSGSGSSVLALDVDTERSLVELERKHGPMPEIFVQSWTGSGNGRWQAFFSYPTSCTIGNSAGRLGPGLDVRANGGYAIVPPSRTRGRYVWALDRSPLRLPPGPAPDWLIALLDSSAAEVIHLPRQGWSSHARAIDAELAILATARKGSRNDALNLASFNLLRFAADGRLPASAIADTLERVASSTGLEQREIRATIRSAATKRGLSLP